MDEMALRLVPVAVCFKKVKGTEGLREFPGARCRRSQVPEGEEKNPKTETQMKTRDYCLWAKGSTANK